MISIKKNGFTAIEILFWLAVLAFLIGGYVYKNTKKVQQETLPPKEERAERQPGDVVRALNTDRINKEKLI